MSRSAWWPLLPLVPLYAAGQALDAMRYERGWRRVERLAWPVISVGNLSVGGAGKTPFVIALARALTLRGWGVDVLSRGYGRISDAVEQVAGDLAEDPAALYGDEPWLIAQAAGVPVFVGRARAAAGRLAEDVLSSTLRFAQDGAPGGAAERRIHMLDDGMQHRRLARDVEIVLVHRSDLETTLLPAGRLREPLASLERADIVVLRDEDAALETRLRRWMRRDAAVWRVRRKLEAPALPGAAVVFSAIAHPEEFVAGLRSQGVAVLAANAWRDHHRYTRADFAKLRRLRARSGAACFVTTEKDAARLTATARAQLERAAPVLTVPLTVHLQEADRCLDMLEERLLRAANRTDGL